MITTLSNIELSEYISRQLNFFYPDRKLVNLRKHQGVVNMALDRIENCYSFCTLKHYFNGKDVIFDHLYSDHYVMILWYLANSLWKERADGQLCNKLYYLNKTLHGIDCMYNTGLPDIFLLFHCSGTMLGKATYSDFFIALQGCTIGSHKEKYPVMGKGVSLTAHSSIIGDCKIGNNVSISANTNVFEKDIVNNSVVYKDSSGKIIVKPSNRPYAQQFFNVEL